ncbi:probable LRR receptor-like serine/threonine-protein kinase At3g47570 [Corylus avellana]|uniref:probable LRR receptor-like serine/threonine-protein kinase At3g47570 n=1 Tax=Corylus avellana TaxID=13451 RepID=UPI00286C4A8D|nr:probable LRR receptor-like serine/threonine-protein kinase At3g47570 [Corylus avellana]
MGHLRRLVYFAVVENDMFGTFPYSLYNISSLRFIAAGANRLNGTLAANISLTLPNLQYLSINTNQFSGPIPVSLSNASQLEFLDLTQNNFVGQVPTDLGNLLNLQHLNIGRNNLGSNSVKDFDFLTSLENCTKLERLGFSYNNFGGTLPDSIGNLSMQLSALYIYGNQIFEIIPAALENLINLSLLVMYKNLFTGPIPTYFGKFQKLQGLALHRNRLSGNIPSSLGNLTQLVLLSLHQNKLEGNIPSSFENCKNKWLHRDRDNESPPKYLNLIQRLNIVIDVASALHYVHDHCEIPIIHCDLKPSNVLLEDDMIAKVSDFGLARIISTTNDASQNQTSTVGIKGTFGYAAPEYGMGGEASTQGDVYSYGIFVSEMFTGKRPTDKIFKDGFNLHNFVKMASTEKLVQVVDPNLLTREVEDLEVATEKDDYNNNDHDDIEAVEERVRIENLSHMNSNE